MSMYLKDILHFCGRFYLPGISGTSKRNFNDISDTRKTHFFDVWLSPVWVGGVLATRTVRMSNNSLVLSCKPNVYHWNRVLATNKAVKMVKIAFFPVY